MQGCARSSAAATLHAFRYLRDPTVNIHLALQPLLALLAGILILIRPKLLSLIVAIYLIVIGVLGLFPGLRL